MNTERKSKTLKTIQPIPVDPRTQDAMTALEEKTSLVWVYSRGEEGCAFKRVGELTYEHAPPILSPLMQFLALCPEVDDLCWHDDTGTTHVIKRKRYGETVTAPR